MMIHKELSLLSPRMQNIVPEVIADCAASPVFQKHKAVLITLETVRELAVQMAYYSRGRMAFIDVAAMYQAAGLYAIGTEEAKQMVTWTLASNHFTGRACDNAPSLDGANPWWAAPAELWEEYGRIVKAHGAQWGGDWASKKRDTPHMEV